MSEEVSSAQSSSNQSGGWTPDGQAPDGRPPDGRTPDDCTHAGRTPDGRTPDGRTPDARTPVVRTFAEADAQGWDQPGLVQLDGPWVRLALYLQEQRSGPTAEGAMVRALEILLTGLVERESCLIMMGLTQATMAAATLIRSPEEVLEQMIAAEPAPAGSRPSRPELRLLQGGLEATER